MVDGYRKSGEIQHTWAYLRRTPPRIEKKYFKRRIRRKREKVNCGGGQTKFSALLAKYSINPELKLIPAQMFCSLTLISEHAPDPTEDIL